MVLWIWRSFLFLLMVLGVSKILLEDTGEMTTAKVTKTEPPAPVITTATITTASSSSQAVTPYADDLRKIELGMGVRAVIRILGRPGWVMLAEENHKNTDDWSTYDDDGAVLFYENGSCLPLKIYLDKSYRVSSVNGVVRNWIEVINNNCLKPGRKYGSEWFPPASMSCQKHPKRRFCHL